MPSTARHSRVFKGTEGAWRAAGLPHLAPSSWVPLHISSSPAPSVSPCCYLLRVGLCPLHLSYSHTHPTTSVWFLPQPPTYHLHHHGPKRLPADYSVSCQSHSQTPGSLLCLSSFLLWEPPHFTPTSLYLPPLWDLLFIITGTPLLGAHLLQSLGSEPLSCWSPQIQGPCEITLPFPP